jgi:hypothetical protein
MLKGGGEQMVHDGDYFRQRAAEARAAAFRRDEGEDAEVAGQLALAYAALAKRHAKAGKATVEADEELAV